MTPTKATPIARALFASALIVAASFLLVSAKQSRARAIAPACFEYEAPAELPEVQQATWRTL
jgi:hypothetical protein